MHTQTTQQAAKTASPDAYQQTRTLSTVRQFSERYPAFSQGSIRNLIFLSSPHYSSRGKILGNGLDNALVRIGRKILIDETKFFEWVDEQQIERV